MKKLPIALTVTALIVSCVGCGNNAEIEALRKDVDELKTTVYGESANDKGNVTGEDMPSSTANVDSAYTLSAGDYEIPDDIETGKYDVICKNGCGVFNVYDEQKGYIISETMDISGETGIEERKNAHVTDGQLINITGTLVVDLIKK